MQTKNMTNMFPFFSFPFSHEKEGIKLVCKQNSKIMYFFHGLNIQLENKTDDLNSKLYTITKQLFHYKKFYGMKTI